MKAFLSRKKLEKKTYAERYNELQPNKKPNLAVQLKEEIGSGSYGKVYRASRVDVDTDQQDYAAKVISKKNAPNDFLKKFLPRELHLCQQLKHPNVVKTHDVINTFDKVVVLMDFAPRGDLLSYCRLRGPLEEFHAQHLFRQIVDGLDYLHQKKIIHRDLKCENILLGASNRCLIADFGFARILKSDEMSETYCGSAAYAAPELLRGVKYNSFGSDIWSIGCILFVMLCHRMPFRDDTVATIVREQKSPPRIPKEIETNLSENGKIILAKMIEFNPIIRITMEELVNDQWLAPPAAPGRLSNISHKST